MSRPWIAQEYTPSSLFFHRNDCPQRNVLSIESSFEVTGIERHAIVVTVEDLRILKLGIRRDNRGSNRCSRIAPVTEQKSSLQLKVARTAPFVPTKDSDSRAGHLACAGRVYCQVFAFTHEQHFSKKSWQLALSI